MIFNYRLHKFAEDGCETDWAVIASLASSAIDLSLDLSYILQVECKQCKSWQHTECVDLHLSTSLASVANPWIAWTECMRARAILVVNWS